MKSKLRWGILGTGNIAGQFAAALVHAHRGEATAVGSRSLSTAVSFAAAHRLSGAYGSYAALLADPRLDAVYVALPNAAHHEWTLRALQAGKHVLCEKPIAATRAQAEEMFMAARRTGLLLAEAFMYRSHPLTPAWLGLVRDGAIGRPLLVRSSFCYCTNRPRGNIRFSRDLAGGALMDVGCYCINLSRLVAGEEPSVVSAGARLGADGIDELTAGTLRFAGGMVASFSCGMTVHADNTASICGSEGYIEVPVPWKPPVQGAKYVLSASAPPMMDRSPDRAAAPTPGSVPKQVFTVDAPGSVFALEADDFAASVFDGAPAVVSESDSLGNMAVLDEMRRQIGMEL